MLRARRSVPHRLSALALSAALLLLVPTGSSIAVHAMSPRQEALATEIERRPACRLSEESKALLEAGHPVQEVPESLRDFARRCPDRAAELLRFQKVVPDEDFWRPRLPRLREALAAQSPELQTEGYPHLWKLEFRLTPPNGHAELRQRVLEDLGRLRGHRLTDSASWWSARKEGLEIVGDSEAVARLTEEAGEVAPCLSWTIDSRTRPWVSKVFTPTADPEDVREVWRLTERWVRQCPEELRYSSLRASTAAKLPEVTDPQIRAEIDRHLAVWNARDRSSRDNPPWALAARLLVDRALDPERAVELARQAVDDVLAEPRMPEEADLLPARVRRQLHLTSCSDAWTLLARAHMVTGNREAAERAITEAERALAELRTLEEDQQELDQVALYPLAQAAMLKALGKQSEKLGHLADAFAFYHRTAALQPDDGDAGEHAARLWQELGGTEWGRKALAAASVADGPKVAEGATGWSPRDRPFPDFELSDLRGHTWTREDLAGKTVLVNVWATWCIPCRKELPLVEQLGERLAGDPGRTVVTLNSDTSTGVVQPFMDEHGFSFPVLLAADFLDREFEDVPLPQTWILDASGTVRLQHTGFDPREAETWIEDVLERLESVEAEE